MLPFFSTSIVDGQPRSVAAVGVKSLVLPKHHMRGALGELNALPAEGHDVRKLVDTVTQILEAGRSVPALAEELSHFRCVSQSQVATSLHLRNFATRLIYSDRHARSPVGRKPYAEYREVMRYHRDASVFFWHAIPWLEAKYSLEAGNQDRKDWTAYGEEVRIARAFKILEETQADYRDVGVLVDLDAQGRLGDPAKTLKRARTSPGWSLFSRTARASATILPLARFPRLYPLVFHVLRRTRRSLPKYLWGRLSPARHPSITRTSEYGRIPGILSEEITVDPAAFGEGRAYFKSQEKPLPDLETARSSLFWMCCRVVATSRVFSEQGMSEARVRWYWSMLTSFNSAWNPKAADAEGRMVRWISGILREGRGISGRDLPKLIRAAQSAYSKILSTTPEEVLVTPALRSALNAHYMHI